MGSLEASTNHMPPRDVSLVRIGLRGDAVAIVRHGVGGRPKQTPVFSTT